MRILIDVCTLLIFRGVTAATRLYGRASESQTRRVVTGRRRPVDGRAGRESESQNKSKSQSFHTIPRLASAFPTSLEC